MFIVLPTPNIEEKNNKMQHQNTVCSNTRFRFFVSFKFDITWQIYSYNNSAFTIAVVFL